MSIINEGEQIMPITQIGSQQIYYDEYGSGTPIILIPGLGANRFSWMKQISSLSDQYHIINLDNRDAGSSGESTGQYDITDMVFDIAGLIENLSLKSVCVIGISMGGFIAQYLALNYSQYISKIVLVSTSAGGPTHLYPKPEILSLLNQNSDNDTRTRMYRLFSLITNPSFGINKAREIERLVDNALKSPMSHEAYMRQLAAAKTHNIIGTRKQLHKILIPTLVIHGENDPIIPFENGIILSKEIPNAHFLPLTNVGHLPHIEATEIFNRAIMEFIGNYK